MKNTEPPKKDLSNVIHESTNKSLQSIAGPFGFLIDFVMPSFHQKKIEKWRENVHYELVRLGKEVDCFKTENLLENSEFTVILTNAVQIANRNFQDEKLKILKNVIINTPECDFSSDLKLTFLGFIDELSLSHISVLHILHQSYDEINTITGYRSLLNFYNKKMGLNLNPHEFKMYVLGLESKGLIRISEDFSDFYNEVFVEEKWSIATGEKRQLSYIKVLDTGVNLLEYITERS